MSTIYGKIRFQEKLIQENELIQMEKALNHWDADDRGCWVKGSIGLGHLMLLNTPESHFEKLPLQSKKNKLVITSDARIDNREELFEKMDILNQGDIITDSELILKSYEKYGNDCVNYLIGDFSFAIWNEEKEELFCARDHMGIKPFYYYYDDVFFAFASEKKGILLIDEMNDEISNDFIIKTFANIPLNNKETIYKNIHRLEGASILIVKNGKISLKKYWVLNTSKETVFEGKEQYTRIFNEIFEEAIRCRMRSNYLIGTELSGGLDSAGITCLATKIAHKDGKQIACFSEVIPIAARQKGMLCDEYYIDLIEKSANIDHLTKIPSNYNSINYKIGKFIKDFDLSLEIADGPTNSFSAFSDQLKKAASEKQIRTLFSGFFGDNLVTCQNKDYYLDYIPEKKYFSFFKEGKHQIGLISSIKIFTKIQMKFIFKNAYILRQKRKISENFKNNSRNFLKKEFYYLAKPHLPINSEKLIRYRDIQKKLIEDYSVSIRFENENQNGKKYKIEPCFPMADIRLIEYILSLPTSEKMKFGKGRLLFKNAMKNIVPELLLEHQSKKNGHSDEFGIKNWQLRQKEAKIWMENNIKKNIIPEFISVEKLMKGYDIDSKKNKFKTIQDLDVFGRFPVESLIRWLEIKNKNR